MNTYLHANTDPFVPRGSEQLPPADPVAVTPTGEAGPGSPQSLREGLAGLDHLADARRAVLLDMQELTVEQRAPWGPPASQDAYQVPRIFTDELIGGTHRAEQQPTVSFARAALDALGRVVRRQHREDPYQLPAHTQELLDSAHATLVPQSTALPGSFPTGVMSRKALLAIRPQPPADKR